MTNTSPRSTVNVASFWRMTSPQPIVRSVTWISASVMGGSQVERVEEQSERRIDDDQREQDGDDRRRRAAPNPLRAARRCESLLARDERDREGEDDALYEAREDVPHRDRLLRLQEVASDRE